MPVPSATRMSMYSADYGVRTPVPTFPYHKAGGDSFEDYDVYGGGIGMDQPVSGISYRAPSVTKAYQYDYNQALSPYPYDYELGGTDMVETLPQISRPYTVAPSYDRQLRATPGAIRSQSQSWGGYENYEPDDSAGMSSTSFFRKSYSIPLSRSGRSGGQWRHIKQATGQTGSNILFIEGTVKDHDVRSFPPFGIVQPEIRYNHFGQRMLPRRRSGSFSGKQNQFNSRAKAGFQYWYNEPKSNISRANIGPIGGVRNKTRPPKVKTKK